MKRILFWLHSQTVNKLRGGACFRKIATFFLLATVVLFASVSCDGGDDAREITVGVVVPLTGVLESTGLNMKNGMELALEEINGSPLLEGTKIRFIIEDSEGTPEGAQRGYSKLIKHDGVAAVLGPFTSTSTREVIPIAHRNKVISFSPTSAASGLSAASEFAFRASLTVERLVPEGVSATRESLRYARVATITNDADTFSRSNLEQLKREFDKYQDISIVSEQSYTRHPDEQLPDLSEQMTRIRDAGPDAVFISALPPGRAGILAQARRLGMEVPFIATLLTIDDVSKANDESGGAGEGAITFTNWLAAIDTPENRKFLRNYREKYGQEPNAFAARSYGAVYLLAEAVASAGSGDPQAIRDAMADLRVENTVFGDFYFDRNGDAVYEPVVGVVRDGRFEVLGQ